MTIDALRQQFPITRAYNFLDHAAVGPLSAPAAQALREYADEVATCSYLKGTYYRQLEHIRQAGARLLGAGPDEITFVKNTTEGLSYVANGIQWATGDNVVLSTLEFPANVYPWMNLQQRGVQIRWVPDEQGRIPFDQLSAAIDQRTRVLSISAVQWGTGFRIDLVRLGELCQRKGVLLCVDAIQALGVHPFDVRTMNIDFLAADGHKWLLGPEGAGFFFCRRELLGHLHPTEVGYMCMKQPFDSTERKIDLYDDARRFDNGAYNLAGICALGASVNLLLEVGIEEIQRHVKALTDRLVEGLRRQEWQVRSPRTASEWSGIVSFGSDKHDLQALRKHLLDEFRIVVSLRQGRLRASPHFYNTPEEIDQLLDALPAV